MLQGIQTSPQFLRNREGSSFASLKSCNPAGPLSVFKLRVVGVLPVIDLTQYVFEALRRDEESILYRCRRREDRTQVLMLSPALRSLRPHAFNRVIWQLWDPLSGFLGGSAAVAGERQEESDAR